MRIGQLIRRIRRRRDITVWSDSRSRPFTEGQAVMDDGQIGPAYAYPVANSVLR